MKKVYKKSTTYTGKMNSYVLDWVENIKKEVRLSNMEKKNVK